MSPEANSSESKQNHREKVVDYLKAGMEEFQSIVYGTTDVIRAKLDKVQATENVNLVPGVWNIQLPNNEVTKAIMDEYGFHKIPTFLLRLNSSDGRQSANFSDNLLCGLSVQPSHTKKDFDVRIVFSENGNVVLTFHFKVPISLRKETGSIGENVVPRRILDFELVGTAVERTGDTIQITLTQQKAHDDTTLHILRSELPAVGLKQ